VNKFENSKIKLIPLVKSANKTEESKNPPQDEDLGSRAHGQSKEKKRFCRRERRICPNIRHLLTNKTKKSTEGWTDIPLHGAQGEGNGDGGEEGDDGPRWNMRSRRLDALDLDRSMPQRGGGVERLSPCPVYGVLFFF